MIEAYYGEGFSITEFREHFSDHRRRLMDGGIPLKPGVVELMDFLAGRGLPLAVATSAGRVTAEHHLGRAGLLDRFTALATRDDVERTKPHPDVYLEAARRLGVAPERCLAFEDSNIGLEAAHAAGAMAFMVPTCCSPCPKRGPDRSKSSPTCTPHSGCCASTSSAGGAPLQWRVMSEPEARGPEEHEKTRHWSGAPPARSSRPRA